MSPASGPSGVRRAAQRPSRSASGVGPRSSGRARLALCELLGHLAARGPARRSRRPPAARGRACPSASRPARRPAGRAGRAATIRPARPRPRRPDRRRPPRRLVRHTGRVGLARHVGLVRAVGQVAVGGASPGAVHAPVEDGGAQRGDLGLQALPLRRHAQVRGFDAHATGGRLGQLLEPGEDVLVGGHGPRVGLDTPVLLAGKQQASERPVARVPRARPPDDRLVLRAGERDVQPAADPRRATRRGAAADGSRSRDLPARRRGSARPAPADRGRRRGRRESGIHDGSQSVG